MSLIKLRCRCSTVKPKVRVHLSQLGGGVSAKELLAAREDAERRAEMAQSRAAGSSWSARAPGTSSTSATTAEKSSNVAPTGVPGAAAGNSMLYIPFQYQVQEGHMYCPT